jgi:hypothetical protein
MINHARTLLLNANYSQVMPSTYPGEEYVPSSFVPIELTHSISNIRGALFGSNPDRATMNYRLHQYLSILHSTELGQFVLDLDPRITYWPRSKRGIFDAPFGVTVTEQSVTAGSSLSVSGTPSTSHDALFETFDVTVASSTTVTIKKTTGSPVSTTETFTVSNSSSGSIPLANTGVAFAIKLPITADKWKVQVLRRPAYDLGQVVQNIEKRVSVATVDNLLLGSAEPYKTFRNLWDKNEFLFYKLGGLLLGLVYRMDEIFQRKVH